MAKARLERSMTEGSPTKLILSFALPIVIGNLFQQFYTMVDTIIVGRYVGTEALAAVGSTGMITFLILGFFMGMTAGFSVPISQCYGAQDDVGVRKAVGSAALLSVFFTALITALSVGGTNWLLTLLNTPEEIFADAYTYIVLLCGGLATQVLYNMLSSILRALGNSKIPLYFLILSAGMNIILDLVFILVFRMGVAGAAWATVISQGVSGLLCLVYIVKKVPILRMHRGDFRPHAPIVKKQLGIGLPMALQFSITSIGGLIEQPGNVSHRRLYRSGKNRAAHPPGLFRPGHDHGDVQCPKHWRGQDHSYPPRFSLGDYYGGHLLHCHRSRCLLLWLKADVAVCHRRSGPRRSAGGHLYEGHCSLLPAAHGDLCLSEWCTGAGLWPAPHDGRRGGAVCPNDRSKDFRTFYELPRHLSGQPCRLGVCRDLLPGSLCCGHPEDTAGVSGRWYTSFTKLKREIIYIVIFGKGL